MNEPRTKGEALLDISYGARLHFLHCRLYRRIRSVLTITSLIAGTSAFAMAMSLLPAAVGLMGIVVAACSIIDAQCNFAERAMRHAQWRVAALELLARAEPMTLAEVDAAWLKLRAGIDDEIESLRTVAMNDNLRAKGFEDSMRSENRVQRLMRVLA